MIILSNEKKAELNLVNRQINSNVEYKSDIELYGKEEFWTIATDRGDCEDYALAKMWRLMDLGWDRNDLRLASCWIVAGDDNTYHAVLTVETDQGTLVLDNNTNAIKLWNDTGFKWHKREVPGAKMWELLP